MLKVFLAQISYRSRVGATTVAFNNTATWRAKNCVAVDGTNGFDVYANSSTSRRTRRPAINQIVDDTKSMDVALPPTISPTNPLNVSQSVNQFYLLDDKKTGVLALGSFSDGIGGFEGQIETLLNGLQALKTLGATQLIVDVVSG